jgi:hypothetical protein
MRISGEGIIVANGLLRRTEQLTSTNSSTFLKCHSQGHIIHAIAVESPNSTYSEEELEVAKSRFIGWMEYFDGIALGQDAQSNILETKVPNMTKFTAEVNRDLSWRTLFRTNYGLFAGLGALDTFVGTKSGFCTERKLPCTQTTMSRSALLTRDSFCLSIVDKEALR